MNLAIKTFDELQALAKEISDMDNGQCKREYCEYFRWCYFIYKLCSLWFTKWKKNQKIAHKVLVMERYRSRIFMECIKIIKWITNGRRKEEMMKFEADKVSELYYINYVYTLYFRHIRNPLMGKSIYLSIYIYYIAHFCLITIQH